jgi:hypothetical protein
MVPDIGFSKSSLRKSVVCCCNSSTRKDRSSDSGEAAGFYGSAGAKVRQQISLCVELTEAAEILRRRIADGRRLVSTRAQERYALIPIVNTPLYAPEAPPVTIGVCAAICLGVLSAKTSSRSTLTEVKFAALAP